MELMSVSILKELDRGPLGKLAYPGGGMVQDVALTVWNQLDTITQMKLYLSGWPSSSRRVMRRFSQGRRFEYGPPNSRGFGEKEYSYLILIVRGRIISFYNWPRPMPESSPDFEDLGKLFRLLDKHVGRDVLKTKHNHSRSVEGWRRLLIQHL